MAEGVLAMSALERERLVVLAEVAAKRVSQRRAAERLGICMRQVKRLVRAYRDGGDGGLVSRQRGRASNHQLASGVLVLLLASSAEHLKRATPGALPPS